MMIDIKNKDDQEKMRIAGKLASEVLDMISNYVAPGNHLGDIGYAIQNHAEKHGYAIVKEYCGHGIGKIYHDHPQILHYGTPGQGIEIKEGMAFTIEPMVNAGRASVRVLPDQWTVVTSDHSLSAQWEFKPKKEKNGKYYVGSDA